MNECRHTKYCWQTILSFLLPFNAANGLNWTTISTIYFSHFERAIHTENLLMPDFIGHNGFDTILLYSHRLSNTFHSFRYIQIKCSEIDFVRPSNVLCARKKKRRTIDDKRVFMRINYVYVQSKYKKKVMTARLCHANGICAVLWPSYEGTISKGKY